MASGKPDWRNIANGRDIPKEFYCDQPYVVVTSDGAWVCVMTTGRGVEGEPGQHVVSTISRDQGRTWSPLIDIESADGPEASWVMPLLTPGGRIYAFYTYNGDNIREIVSGYFDGAPGEQVISRVDTLGYMAYKYSDDGGLTWSAQRWYIPIRNFETDRSNRHGGEVQYFWGVGKPIIHQGNAYIGFAKVGKFGDGFMEQSEGAFLKSDNILTETDPTLIRWQTLPDGDVGLRAPTGQVADEHNPVGLSDGSLYCTFRTVTGHNGQAYSRDGGRTWTGPEYAVYEPGGRRLKHPRAANFVKKFSNGKFLLWYHNHGLNYLDRPSTAYYGRNPAWISGGVERDGYIYWSQPEILLYDDDPTVRMSYPDFIEDGGRYFVTETQKEIARVHEIDAALLEGLWAQRERCEVSRHGLAVELNGPEACGGAKVDLSTGERVDGAGQTGAVTVAGHVGGVEREQGELAPRTPRYRKLPGFCDLRQGGGFTLDVRFRLGSSSAEEGGHVLLDSTGASGAGFRLLTAGGGALLLELSDGSTAAYWESDAGLLLAGAEHHVTAIVEGGPKLILFVVDGQLCDGGAQRQYGWGRFSPHLGEVAGSGVLLAGKSEAVELHTVRVYNRPLRVSEAVAHRRAGQEA